MQLIFGVKSLMLFVQFNTHWIWDACYLAACCLRFHLPYSFFCFSMRCSFIWFIRANISRIFMYYTINQKHVEFVRDGQINISVGFFKPSGLTDSGSCSTLLSLSWWHFDRNYHFSSTSCSEVSAVVPFVQIKDIVMQFLSSKCCVIRMHFTPPLSHTSHLSTSIPAIAFLTSSIYNTIFFKMPRCLKKVLR